MVDIKNIPPYNSFTYWFEPYEVKGTFICYKVFKDGEEVGAYQVSDLSDTYHHSHYGTVVFEDSNEESIFSKDLNNFENRPESMIGWKSGIAPSSATDNIVDTMIDDYETLLLGAYLMRIWQNTHQSPDEYIEIFNNSCLEWLRHSDMYSAPSSTRYHDACPGGLLFHSLKVYNLMHDMLKLESFKDVDIISIAITALTHDWCKIGLYESYKRNVKNESTGQWEQVTAYRHNQQGIPLGHGVSSMYLASRFFNLSVEESLAIRWHMSYWAVAPGEDSEMAKACDTYPLVEMIQFADQLSIRQYAKWFGKYDTTL